MVCEFLQTSYWAKGRRRSVIERAVKELSVSGWYQDGRQVGFARVVSDRAVFAYLMDVFVIPEYRGQGISKKLVRAVLDHPELQNLRVFLLATKDAHGLDSIRVSSTGGTGAVDGDPGHRQRYACQMTQIAEEKCPNRTRHWCRDGLKRSGTSVVQRRLTRC